MPPPPPPPPPPPSASTTGSADRSGLLGEIGNFRKGGLKKTVTNDRSAPLVSGSSNNNNARNTNTNTNRSNTNERPSTVPLITPNQLNSTVLKPSSTGGSTVKAKKPSISQVTPPPPPPPPPPPVHQPVVKTPSFDHSRNGVDSVSSARHFAHQPPRLPPREPPPPPPSIENKPKLGQLSNSQQRITRAPPPPPPPYSSTNNGHTTSNNTPKQTNPNCPPPPPPPPPRGVIPTNNNGSVRRPPSDFVDNTYSDRRYDSAALEYDHHFEARYRFTPLEQLPIPERWQPPPTHSRSSKHHVNVR